MREVDGFVLEATTVREDLSSPYHSAAIRVTKPESHLEKIHVLYGQDFERHSQEQALEAARNYIETVVAVNHYGQPWDRPKG